jgi:hypothetical protein
MIYLRLFIFYASFVVEGERLNPQWENFKFVHTIMK